MYIEDRIDTLEKKLDLLLSLVGGDSTIMTITDIAAFYGKKRASLYRLRSISRTCLLLRR